MPSIDPVQRGQKLLVEEENRLRSQVQRSSEPDMPGITVEASSAGLTASLPDKTLTRLFELTEDQQYPDAQTPPDGLPTLPDIPWAENCRAVWLDHSLNTYGIGGSVPETVYFPTITNFDPSDDPLVVSGDRIEATWDAQAGRWQSVAVTPTTSTATVIRCQVNQSTVAITDDTFSVDGVTVISPSGASTPTVTTVNNVLHFSSSEDNQCLAFLDGGTWYGIPEPDLVASTVVTTVDYTPGSPSAFQAKTRDVVGFSQTDETSFATWHTMVLATNIDVDMRLNGDDLEQLWHNMYILEATTSNVWDAWHATASC